MKSLRDRLKEEILSLTEEECALLLQAWKLHMAHPELSEQECVKAALDAANIHDGKVDTSDQIVSASDNIRESEEFQV